MKIIFVNTDQFRLTWEKIQPQIRIMADINHPNLVLPHLNTLLILDDNVEVGSLSQFSGADFSLRWLYDCIQQKGYSRERKNDSA